MDVYEFNKVVYNGNINKDFYLYCLRKNKKIYNIGNNFSYICFFITKKIYS